MFKITIPGELTDLNTFIGAINRNRFLGNKIKQEETDRVTWLVKTKRAKLKYPVFITFLWYSKDQRKDIDNVSFSKKFILDGLVRGGILENDSRKFISGFRDDFFIDKENPRVEIEIK